jgi:hypothetical protein
MKSLFPCEFCGKIFSGRKGKHTCSNLCAVKLNYAVKHNYQTPFQLYVQSDSYVCRAAGTLQGFPIEPESHLINSFSKVTEDNSHVILQNAQSRLKEFNNLIN